jgi:hypothetical protein
MKVIGFGCGPCRWYRGVGEVHMNKGRVGEERGGKEMDRCPLTATNDIQRIAVPSLLVPSLLVPSLLVPSLP